MSDNHCASYDRDARLEDFAAELTLAAYHVALRHGTGGTWLDLELELWRVKTEMIEKWGRDRPLAQLAAFACDWAGGQPEAAHGHDRDGLGPWREVRRPLSGE
jgi:hypothetical protein